MPFQPIDQNPGLYFPLFFAMMWLAITTLLLLNSGWFRLMESFPNRPEEPRLKLRAQSGSMGFGVHMKGILTLSICPSGLRIGIMRIFGPFCRDFFVPWDQLTITRKTTFFRSIAKLQFGHPMVGSLTIAELVANRLAHAGDGRWPETATLHKETRRDTARRLLTRWALTTSAAASFFIIAPMAVAPTGARPPIAVAILFPAIVFGIGTVVTYFRERN